MLRLRVAITTVMLMALIFNVVGGNDKLRHGHHHGHQSKPCADNPSDPACTSTTTVISTTESSEVESEETSATSTSETTSTSDPSALERAHWCRFGNGTYLPLGTTYMKNICTMCQCRKSRAITCDLLECLPTYCIDNKMPVRKPDQCCAQCDYEVATNSCVYNGVTYPHGVVMKTVGTVSQCWCQLGNIECRNYIGSLFASLNMLADEKVALVILAVLALVLFFGLLLCCSCTFFIYYYYQRYQSTFQQAYDQYINPAGWQPMEEEEQYVVDESTGEKYPPVDSSDEMAPPPYAVDNDAYLSDEKKK